MAYIQLADNNPEAEYYTQLAEADPTDLYIFIPTDRDGNGKWVREDYFDQFPDWEYEKIMEALAPYQSVGTSGLFGDFFSQERREERRERRRKRREARQQAREVRAEQGGVFGQIAGALGNIFGNKQIDAGFDIQSGQAPTGYLRTDQGMNPALKTGLWILGGVVVIGGTIYFIKKSKK